MQYIRGQLKISTWIFLTDFFIVGLDILYVLDIKFGHFLRESFLALIQIFLYILEAYFDYIKRGGVDIFIGF